MLGELLTLPAAAAASSKGIDSLLLFPLPALFGTEGPAPIDVDEAFRTGESDSGDTESVSLDELVELWKAVPPEEELDMSSCWICC